LRRLKIENKKILLIGTIFIINCERFNGILWIVVIVLGSVRPEGEWEEMMKMTLEMLLVCAEHTKVQVPGLSIVLPSVVDQDLELFGQFGSVSGIILPDLTFLTRITA
jgi:hypothetical protein